MNHVNDGCIHGRRGDIIVCSYQQLTQWAAQLLRIAHIDGDELQNAVLRNHTEDMGPIGLAIVRNEGDSACAGLEHAATGFVQGSLGINGDGLGRRYTQGFLNLCSRSDLGSALSRSCRAMEETGRTTKAI